MAFQAGAFQYPGFQQDHTFWDSWGFQKCAFQFPGYQTRKCNDRRGFQKCAFQYPGFQTDLCPIIYPDTPGGNGCGGPDRKQYNRAQTEGKIFNYKLASRRQEEQLIIEFITHFTTQYL